MRDGEVGNLTTRKRLWVTKDIRLVTGCMCDRQWCEPETDKEGRSIGPRSPGSDNHKHFGRGRLGVEIVLVIKI